MEDFQTFLSYILNFFNMSTIRDFLDILIVTVVLFYAIKFLRKTTAMRAVLSILALYALTRVADIAGLSTVYFILNSTVQVGVIALVILFQPELRRALEQIGSKQIASLFGQAPPGNMEYVILQTVGACRTMAGERVGALIVFQKSTKLDDIVRTGTMIDAELTAELLKNIFFPKAPLHDGAAIVQNGRLTGAGCVLPLTANQNLSKELGTRHRAGIGMSENSDAVIVVVSEETGAISVAIDGMLKRHLSADTLEKLLRQNLLPQDEKKRRKLRISLKKGKKDSKS